MTPPGMETEILKIQVPFKTLIKGGSISTNQVARYDQAATVDRIDDHRLAVVPTPQADIECSRSPIRKESLNFTSNAPVVVIIVLDRWYYDLLDFSVPFGTICQ